MKEMTREEIDKKLKILRETRKDEDSYIYNKPAMAMCYSMVFRELATYKLKLVCAYCKQRNKKPEETIKDFEGEINEDSLIKILEFYDPETIVEIKKIKRPNDDKMIKFGFMNWLWDEMKNNPTRYHAYKDNEEEYIKIYEKEVFYKGKTAEELDKIEIEKLIKKHRYFIDKFKELGLDARLEYYCEPNKPMFKVSLKTKDGLLHSSEPQIYSFIGNERTTSNQEYQMVIDFLSKKQGKQDLAAVFDKIYNKDFRASEIEYFVYAKKLDFSKIKDITTQKAFKEIDKDLKNLYARANKDRAYLIKPDSHRFLFHRFEDLYNKNRKKENLLYNDIYCYGDYSKRGLIKTQIDLALQKVLGIEILYDKAEIVKNLKVVLKEEGEQEKLSEILKILDKEPKDFDNYINFLYDNYIGERLEISRPDFCRNFLNYHKDGEIEEKDYKLVLALLYNFSKEQSLNVDIETEKEFEFYLIDNFNYFSNILEGFYYPIDDMYRKFIREKAKKERMDSFDEFYAKYCLNKEKLNVAEYVGLVDDLKKYISKPKQPLYEKVQQTRCTDIFRKGSPVVRKPLVSFGIEEESED